MKLRYAAVDANNAVVGFDCGPRPLRALFS